MTGKGVSAVPLCLVGMHKSTTYVELGVATNLNLYLLF